MPVSSVSLERDFIADADLSENHKLRRALANANALLADQGRVGAELRRQLKAKDATNAGLLARIATLEGQVTDLISAFRAQDPTTSSTPPSSVQPHQRKYPTKTPSGKPAGRAKGAPGKAPQWSSTPDEVVNHRPTRCPNGHLLDPSGEATLREARQVREIEQIIEHRLLDVECEECAAKSHTEFPPSVRTRISWGPSVRSFALLLSQRAFLPTQASVNTLAALGIVVSKLLGSMAAGFGACTEQPVHASPTHGAFESGLAGA